jgi:hypothetical protein
LLFRLRLRPNLLPRLPRLPRLPYLLRLLI